MSTINELLGAHLSGSALSASQFAWRTVFVFAFGILLFRLADRRFLGREAGFDVLLWVILGSVLSRAINGQAPFWPTLGASFGLIILHRAASTLAFHFHRFSVLVKGRAAVLVQNGQKAPERLRHYKISDDDLDEGVRLAANVTDLARVAEARLERNGQISVVRTREK